jgi:hypothetical protein
MSGAVLLGGGSRRHAGDGRARPVELVLVPPRGSDVLTYRPAARSYRNREGWIAAVTAAVYAS